MSPSQSSAADLILSLRRAVVGVEANHTVEDTLRMIVTSAAQLAGARYSALAIPEDAGAGIATFVSVGMSPEEQRLIGHLPRGLGVLGVVLRDRQPLRLARIAEHPESIGFPRHHPPMASFLGVPVIDQEVCYGILYLAEKQSAPEFSDVDQALVEMLAVHAAHALASAHASEQIRAHVTELNAVNAVIMATGRHLGMRATLQEALDRTIELYGAAAGEILLYEEGAEELVITLYRGELSGPFHRLLRIGLGQGIAGQAAASRAAIVEHALERNGLVRPDLIDAGYRAIACLPLLSDAGLVGVLALLFRDPAVFERMNDDLLAAVCRQVAIAVEHARLHNQAGRVAVLEERQRIAMDLHDGVIQSIYAVGLQLELAQALAADAKAADILRQLEGPTRQLQTVIDDIRAYIRDMRPLGFQGTSLAAELEKLTADFMGATRVLCRLTADAQADQALTVEARHALLHIAREALSNAVRHGRATQVDVYLGNTGLGLVLAVRDNGSGFDPAQVRAGGHGLRNMRERAEALAGRMEIGLAPGAGTELRITVPVPQLASVPVLGLNLVDN